MKRLALTLSIALLSGCVNTVKLNMPIASIALGRIDDKLNSMSNVKSEEASLLIQEAKLIVKQIEATTNNLNGTYSYSTINSIVIRSRLLYDRTKTYVIAHKAEIPDDALMTLLSIDSDVQYLNNVWNEIDASYTKDQERIKEGITMTVKILIKIAALMVANSIV